MSRLRVLILLFTLLLSLPPAWGGHVHGTRFLTGQTTCTTSATLIRGANAARISILISNNSATTAFVGASTVSTSSGTHLEQNARIVVDVSPSPALYCLVASGTAILTWFEELQ